MAYPRKRRSYRPIIRRSRPRRTYKKKPFYMKKKFGMVALAAAGLVGGLLAVKSDKYKETMEKIGKSIPDLKKS